MSAELLHLPPPLHQAWMDGALSFREAWAIQDEMLLSTKEWVVMPEILEPQLNKLHFYQMPTFNDLPL